jgi:hypothetical protein
MTKFALKKFIQSALLLVVLCTTATTYAQVSQAPDGIQFQALATDANGHPAAGRVIYVKDAIVAKTATGTIVYSETFKVTASSAGIFTIVLGKGTYASGVSSIANIDWANGPFFLNLKIAVEPTVPTASWNVNNEYVDLGTSQFWSVPYAMYAGSVKGLDTKLNISDTAAMLKPYFTSINLKANIESPTFTGTVRGITKAMVGLGNVDNTADLDKPVSTATQTALDLKANATDVTTALALKANASDVTTALALKANASDVTTALALKANAADVTTALDLKVDKVTGKALSTNDYTAAEKTKLAAITGTNTGDQDLSALATNTALALKANTTDVNTSLNLKANTSDVAASLATKVDKVTGKDLSTNDFTTAEKTKLAAITGTNTGDQDLSALATNTALALKANTTDVTNSLALKANVSSLSTVATSGSYNDLSNKPAIPSAYTLPTASASVLGGVKVGSNLSIDASGVLSANVNAGSVSGTVTVANGGTGATTLTGLVKGNGTNALTAAVAGTDYQAPLTLTTTGTGAATFSGTTLNIPLVSSTVDAGSISGTVTVANGGTGATTLTGLVKGNGTNALTAAVAGTDYQAPLTLTTAGTGAATFSGTTLNIPLVSSTVDAGSISGTVTVANGGTGATTLTGLVKGNGTNALTEAIAGTDYQAPLTLTTTGTGAATFSGTTLNIPLVSSTVDAGSISGTVTVANGGTGATTLTGLVKGNGTNALTAAVAGTDYQAPLTLTTTGTGAATFSGTTLTIPTYSLPIADGTNLGGVKVGSNLNVDVDGVLTANINAGTLTGTTLAANVVNSSLTSVGTITSGTWSGTIIAVTKGGTGTSNGSITGTSALTFAAGGTNENVSIKPSGTGSVFVGTGTSTPTSSSAILEASSTTQGFLPPRLTTTQRDAITGPVAGLTIWNTTNTQLEVFDGSYWKNMVGLLVSPLKVGDTYGGGKVFYIFGPSDIGFIKGQTHGLIASLSDQGPADGIKWFPGAFYGATATNLGTGIANTALIMVVATAFSANVTSYAAGLANSCNDGGYVDWFLPSKDELNKLYQQKGLFNNFGNVDPYGYWSSSQKGQLNINNYMNGINSAHFQRFNDGFQGDTGLNEKRRVRAIRIF